ncbi:hypothetical protein KDH_69810 [Dictyobacter sp. S3.2.2.5]|uniref:Uncharacterized protein n=1 Tax=Dictyobacter halimunensis TaxID=3026934 RepID=A0ABQ6G4H6_9CHLR|nr:hypothetical protein KDH_69810 [Dictyobacter sp. S3.2.2.5]
MAYLSKVATSLLGACALLFMLSVPGFAATHTPTTMATYHTPKHASWKIKEGAFLCILTAANRIVLASYPQAQFYEAQGTPQNGRGIVAQDVNQWLFVFNNPATIPNSTIKLPFQDDHFGEIEYIQGPFVEDQVINLPLPTGLDEAITLLRQHYDTPFSTVTVRFPLAREKTEPYYIFGLPDVRLWVFVGIYSHNVTTAAMTA